MVYRTIGLMSGSSLDGLDIVYAEFQENGGKWTYDILQADCYSYSSEWMDRLRNATTLSALDYQLLHVDFGHYVGDAVNKFIEAHGLQYKVALVASHGHTTFHVPSRKMTAQLGEGAAIAAVTQLPVVADLRAMDLALGGEGAPIVPIGERLLLGDFDYFLNLGGIANISAAIIKNEAEGETYVAFDICPANRVLNLLAAELGHEYDNGGAISATGKVDMRLLDQLNGMDYYKQNFPKSLANDFGTDVLFPIVKNAGLATKDAMRTFTEHIVVQISNNVALLQKMKTHGGAQQLLATGGGGFNDFMVELLRAALIKLEVTLVVPDARLVNFKEALIMALMGVLRWRQENNVLSSVTGSARDSVGGSLWIGG